MYTQIPRFSLSMYNFELSPESKTEREAVFPLSSKVHSVNEHTVPYHNCFRFAFVLVCVVL